MLLNILQPERATLVVLCGEARVSVSSLSFI